MLSLPPICPSARMSDGLTQSKDSASSATIRAPVADSLSSVPKAMAAFRRVLGSSSWRTHSNTFLPGARRASSSRRPIFPRRWAILRLFSSGAVSAASNRASNAPFAFRIIRSPTKNRKGMSGSPKRSTNCRASSLASPTMRRSSNNRRTRFSRSARLGLRLRGLHRSVVASS